MPRVFITSWLDHLEFLLVKKRVLINEDEGLIIIYKKKGNKTLVLEIKNLNHTSTEG